MLNLITEFSTDYGRVISGAYDDISGEELSGGARISFVFHEIFSQAIKSLDPFDQVNDVDIRTILYNSSVITPKLILGFFALSFCWHGCIRDSFRNA
jgi:replication fork clamp-binding protein CrfC